MSGHQITRGLEAGIGTGVFVGLNALTSAIQAVGAEKEARAQESWDAFEHGHAVRSAQLEALQPRAVIRVAQALAERVALEQQANAALRAQLAAEQARTAGLSQELTRTQDIVVDLRLQVQDLAEA